jgi:hypothetical protein
MGGDSGGLLRRVTTERWTTTPKAPFAIPLDSSWTLQTLTNNWGNVRNWRTQRRKFAIDDLVAQLLLDTCFLSLLGVRRGNFAAR